MLRRKTDLFLHTKRKWATLLLIFTLWSTVLIAPLSISAQDKNNSPQPGFFQTVGHDIVAVVSAPLSWVGNIFKSEPTTKANPSPSSNSKVLGVTTQGLSLDDRVAAVEQKLSQFTLSTTPVTQNSLSLTAIDTAGGNLLRNSSFEAADSNKPRQWGYVLDSTSSNTFQSAEGIHSGSWGLKFQGGGTGNFGISQVDTKTIPGRTYTISAYIKVVNASSATVRLGFWDELNNKEGNLKNVSVSGTQDWSRISSTVTTRGLITDTKNYYPMIQVQSLTSGNIYLDDVQLTEGSVLTAYNSATALSSGNGLTLGDGSILGSASGNLYPAQSGNGSLGLSSNKWSALYLNNATIDSNGSLTLGNALSVTSGGTGLTGVTTGDILYASSSNTLKQLSIGTSNQVLTVSGGLPVWTTSSSSTCPTCIVTNPSSTQTITPTAAAATGLSVAQASGGTADIFNVTNNAGSTKYLTVASTGNVTVTSAGALNLTGAAASTWDIGANTLSLQTTGNGAITTGTGLLTVGGNQTFSGVAARTITGPNTGAGGALVLTTTGNASGLTLNTAAGASGNSGAISIVSGGTSVSGSSGAVTIDSGAAATLSNSGAVNIGNTNATAINLGNATNNTTLTLTGTGLTTLGGGLTFSGTAARTITGPNTGGLTMTVASGPLTLSTTTSGTLAVTSAGALNLTGAAASTWDIGANTLSLQTTGNGAITTGTGLVTLGGGLTYSGTAARTITGPNTGGLTITVASGPLTLSTTTSGTLAITGAGALNLTGAAASTWDIGANTLSLQTTGNGAITTGTGLLTLGGGLTFSGTAARTITGPGTGGLTMTVASGPLTLSTTTSGTLAVTSAGAVNLTGAAASTWDIGANTLSLQTTGNGAITTGTGLLTVGGNQTFSGVAARTITGPNTGAAGGLTITTPNTTSANSTGITISTGTTSTSGTTGGISMDVGAGVANGTITIGTANALALTIGRSGITTTLNGTQNVSGAFVLGPATTHFKSSQTTAPTIGTPTACGTTPTASVAAGSSDNAGSFTITAGTGTPGNCAAVVNFNTAFGAAPKSIILTPTTSTGPAKNAYISASAAGTFTVTLNTAPAASEANSWNYWIVE